MTGGLATANPATLLRRVPAVAWATGAAALALWPFPLVQVLHAESGAVIAAVAFVAAGQGAISAARRGESAGRIVVRRVAALALPWLLLTISLLWAPNRDYARGALLWWTAAAPAAALGAALGIALARRGWRRARLWHVGLALAVALAGPAFDLGFHPQVYTYNHVWGGVLGPIYDDDLAVRPGLFAFRALTLAWAALLVALAGPPVPADSTHSEAPSPQPNRQHHLTPPETVAEPVDARASGRPLSLSTRRRAVALALAVLIAAAYALRGPLGINTTHAALVAALGEDGAAVERTTRAVVVGRGVSGDEVEFRLADLAARLGAWPSEPVWVFVYPDVETRRRLLGAGETSVAPVWLARPQIHLVASSADVHLGHELAHAVSREFGLPLLHASRSVGLVEGLAVAAEPPDGGPSPAALVSAAEVGRVDVGRGDVGTGDADDVALAQRLSATLGAGGFWGGRGAVSYTTTGAFVGWLLRTHGPERLRAVYAWGDYERVYGVPLDTLARQWAREVTRGVPSVPLAAGPVARASFSAPSLFERPSPHHVPREVRETRAADRDLARGDTAAATARLAAVLARAPRFAPALDRWARLLLVRAARGDRRAASAALGRLRAADLRALDVRTGDAWLAAGWAAGGPAWQADSARARYRAARHRLSPAAHEAAAWLWSREALAADPGLLARLYARDTARWGANGERDAAFGPAVPCGAAPPAGRTGAAPPPPDLPGLAARIGAVALARAGRCDAAAARFAALGDADAAAYWRDRAALGRWMRRGAGR